MSKKPHKTWTIAKFEFVRLITSRSFQVSTLITLIILALFLSFPSLQKLFRSSQNSKGSIGLINQSAVMLDLEAAQTALPNYELKISEANTDEEIEAALEADKDLFGVLALNNQEKFTWYTRRQDFMQSPETILYQNLRAQVQLAQLTEEGVSPEEAKAFIQGPGFEVVDFAAQGGKGQEQTHAYTYFLVFLLYMCIVAYGQLTATSVAYEKSTRAMELLITSAKPQQLINGKVLGVGLAGVLQMLVFGVFYLICYQLNQASYAADSFFAVGLDMPTDILLMAVICFLLCYLALAYIYAALGSLVSRADEVNQVIGPITMLVILVFMAAIFATFMPDKSWVTIVSYLPLFGPLLLFVRYSMLGLGLGEIAILMVIHLLVLLLCSWLASKVYQRGVLRYGKTAKFSDFFALFREHKKEKSETEA